MSRIQLVPVLLFVLCRCALAVELEYVFPETKVLRYKYMSRESVSYKAKTGKVVERRSTEYELELLGQNRTDFGNVKATFRNLKSSVAAPGEGFSFDSRKTYSQDKVEKDPIYGALSAMVGDSFHFRVGANGGVSRVDGFVDLTARAMSRGLTGARILEKPLLKLMKTVFSDDVICSGFNIVFVAFPDKPLPGTKWKEEIRFDFAGIVEIMRLEYALKTLGASKASVVVSGIYAISIDGSEVPKAGDISGSSLFDVENNRILYSSVKTNIKLPNVSIANEFELKYVKDLELSEAGPRSFEKPLGPLQKLIERRIVKGDKRNNAVVFESDRCEKVAFLACDGDEVRVVAQIEKDGKRLVHVVTALGRDGWMAESDSTPAPD